MDTVFGILIALGFIWSCLAMLGWAIRCAFNAFHRPRNVCAMCSRYLDDIGAWFECPNVKHIAPLPRPTKEVLRYP